MRPHQQFFVLKNQRVWRIVPPCKAARARWWALAKWEARSTRRSPPSFPSEGCGSPSRPGRSRAKCDPIVDAHDRMMTAADGTGAMTSPQTPFPTSQHIPSRLLQHAELSGRILCFSLTNWPLRFRAASLWMPAAARRERHEGPEGFPPRPWKSMAPPHGPLDWRNDEINELVKTQILFRSQAWESGCAPGQLTSSRGRSKRPLCSWASCMPRRLWKRLLRTCRRLPTT